MLNKERPIVIVMNNVAASGGYLVATAFRWIVAQLATITGSIGAVIGKLVDEGLFYKLHMNRVTFSRGENANMLSAEGVAFMDAQRTRMREMLEYCSLFSTMYTFSIACASNITCTGCPNLTGQFPTLAQMRAAARMCTWP